MKIVGTSQDCLEARQQQRHRHDILAVVGEDRIQDMGIAIAEPGEVPARDQTARQVIRAMQVEHDLLNGLQQPIAVGKHYVVKLAALCFFNVSNRATFSRIFKREMATPDALARRREIVIDTVMRYVKSIHHGNGRPTMIE